MSIVKPRKRLRLAAVAAVGLAAACIWAWNVGDRIPVVWRLEATATQATSKTCVVGWSADSETFYAYAINGPAAVPRLQRRSRRDGRVLSDIALPPTVRWNDEPRVLELLEGRLAVLADRLYVGRFADGLGQPSTVAVAKVAAPLRLFSGPPALSDDGRRLSIPWSTYDAATQSNGPAGVTSVGLDDMEVSRWSVAGGGSVHGATADGDRLMLTCKVVRADGSTEFPGVIASRGGREVVLSEMIGNVVPWSDECVVGIGLGFDGESAERLRLRSVPLDGSPPRILHDGVVSTQPTATIRGPAGRPAAGWYFFSFVDYEGAGSAVYFPAAHRYLAHIAGDPLGGGRADCVIHEVRRDIDVGGRNFAGGWTLATPHFSPDGQWLLLDASDGGIELVDLRSLLK